MAWDQDALPLHAAPANKTEPLPRPTLSRWRQFIRSEWAAALLATLGLRLGCSLIAALAWLNGPQAGYVPGNLALSLTAPWLHWDTAWYLRIARDGYGAFYGTTAFMPLYPLLAHIVGVALGNQYLVAALLISTIATFGVFLCLYRLAEKLSAAPSVAPWTLLAAALLPVSFFLVAGYTEALFLWAALGAILAFLEDHWGRLALLSVVATLTRHQGLLLSLLIVPMLASAFLACVHQRWASASLRAAAALWRPALAACAGPVAYLAWLLIVKVGLHAPLPWEPLAAANGWNLHSTWPGAGVIADLVALARGAIPEPLGLSVPLDAVAAILAGSTILFAVRRLPPGIVLYVVGCWCLALVKVQSAGLTISAARYLLAALPLAVLPGEFLAGRHRTVRLLWLALGTTLLFILTWAFTSGGWIS